MESNGGRSGAGQQPSHEQMGYCCSLSGAPRREPTLSSLTSQPPVWWPFTMQQEPGT